MQMINWKTTKKDSRLIRAIVDRAMAIFEADPDITYSKSDCHMDIRACHVNGCELDLERLLSFPDADFGHDVFGIRRYIDRDTGKLTDYFVPRCAV